MNDFKRTNVLAPYQILVKSQCTASSYILFIVKAAIKQCIHILSQYSIDTIVFTLYWNLKTPLKTVKYKVNVTYNYGNPQKYLILIEL